MCGTAIFMTNSNSFCGFPVVALLVMALLAPLVSFAQEPQGGQTPPGAPPAGAPAGQPSDGRQRPGNSGSDRTPQQQTTFPDLEQRPIFLSGNVKLADGTNPPDRVLIERVCQGIVRPEAYTDSKGNFSFQLGARNPAVFYDASVGGADPLSPGTDPSGIGGQRGINESDLTGCEIRANLAGFQSDSIVLGFRRSLDNPDIGIIRLRRLANVEGYTFSITTAQAPKDARRAYEKGLELSNKRKWAEAERELTKAVGSYPKYAAAWHELGRAYQQQKKLDDAVRAYREAINADSKFINPYGQLAGLAAYEQKWDDVVQYTSQMLKLNPFVAPDFYFYSALANYNLQNIDVAEGHAREAAKRDTQHRVPKINHLLGIILAEKQDYSGAAENIRIYLKFSPNASDADTVRQLLADVETAATQGTVR
jgi:tetratricopeptide (TPR) repeat protein